MTDANENKRIIAASDAPIFETAVEKLACFHDEVAKLSNKKPDGQLSKFKLGFINQVLEPINRILGEDYRPFPDFTVFDVDGGMPTASDALMMLAQYKTAIANFTKDHRILVPDPRYRGDERKKSIWNTGDDQPTKFAAEEDDEDEDFDEEGDEDSEDELDDEEE